MFGPVLIFFYIQWNDAWQCRAFSKPIFIHTGLNVLWYYYVYCLGSVYILKLWLAQSPAALSDQLLHPHHLFSLYLIFKPPVQWMGLQVKSVSMSILDDRLVLSVLVCVWKEEDFSCLCCTLSQTLMGLRGERMQSAHSRPAQLSDKNQLNFKVL